MRISVAVPVPNLDLLTYAVPDGIALPAIGARVVVPLGSRVVTGIVIDHASADDASRDVKFVQQVLDAEAFVPPEVVALAKWTAEYYAAGVGDTIPALLPPKARGARADAHKTVRIASITAAGLAALESARRPSCVSTPLSSRRRNGRALTAKQREALELLAGAPDGIPTAALAGRGIAAICNLPPRAAWLSQRTAPSARPRSVRRSDPRPVRSPLKLQVLGSDPLEAGLQRDL